MTIEDNVYFTNRLESTSKHNDFKAFAILSEETTKEVVNFSISYLFSPPVFSFENTKGLSDDDLKKLKDEIVENANALCGEVNHI